MGSETSDVDLGQGHVATPKISRDWLWQGKVWPAFWPVASLLSLSVDILLIVILVLVGKQLFPLKQLLTQQLLGGMYYNFVQMDRAQIKLSVCGKSFRPITGSSADCQIPGRS